MDTTTYSNNNWKNANIDSAVPSLCRKRPCNLGIDEAGRGPVLGPMVYSGCYYPKDCEDDVKSLGVSDSKVLTESKRIDILNLIHENDSYIGYCLEVLSPAYISNCMYERSKISLNEVSHNSAASLIRRIINNHDVLVENVFVDTVGDPAAYQAKLKEMFPALTITVSKKADSLFPSVSAASICAKVARDKILQEWKFPEDLSIDVWGSGYPGDSVTKNFLNSSLDRIFGFPALVRFSWSTAEKILEEKGVSVKWLHEVAEEEDENTPSVLQYFAKKRKLSSGTEEPTPVCKNNSKRHFYYIDRSLSRVSEL
ncbi:UNVERIFIED_CONTAM: hypothetical protein RMT77_002962 [Armadillidium vulgare]